MLPKIGISACLVGDNIRYDGGNKLNPWIADTLSNLAIFYPICPESECGMSTPRPPMHLTKDSQNPRLIITSTGEDVTERMLNWINKKIEEIKTENLSGFILKSKSPSCNIRSNPNGVGLFAKAIIKEFPDIPLIDENDIEDQEKKNQFLKQISELSK